MRFELPRPVAVYEEAAEVPERKPVRKTRVAKQVDAARADSVDDATAALKDLRQGQGTSPLDAKGSTAAELLTTLIPVELIALYGVINAWDLNRWLSLVLASVGALMAVGLTYYDYRIKPSNDRKAMVAHLFIAPAAFLIWGATLRSPYIRLLGIDPDDVTFGISMTAIALVFTAGAAVLYKVVGKVPASST